MAEVQEDPIQLVLTCAVCNQVFGPGDKEPRLLKCQHSICLGCLQRLCQGDGVVCPKCPGEPRVQGTAEDAFPVDQRRMEIVDLVREMASVNIQEEQQASSVSTEEQQASASSSLPRVQFPEFLLCKDCVNITKCHVSSSGDVLENTTQPDPPHTHPVFPSPHSPHPPSPSPPSLLTPSSSSPSPSPLSVSPPLPQFLRLRKYGGTLGRVVLETGQHYWEVEASFMSKRWNKDWYFCEMGVVSPGEQDSGEWMLGCNAESAWGIKLLSCEKCKESSRPLCIVSWEGKKEVDHVQMGDLPKPDKFDNIRVGLLLDVQAKTLVCVDVKEKKKLCTLKNVRPPLSPCFAVKPREGKKFDFSLRVVTGDRTAVDRGWLEQLRGEAGDSESSSTPQNQ